MIIILQQKYKAVYWLRGMDSYIFVIILSSVNNIFAYYLLKTTFLEKTMKTDPENTDESVASSV